MKRRTWKIVSAIWSMLVAAICFSCRISSPTLKPEVVLPDSYIGIKDSVNAGAFPWQMFYHDTLLVELLDGAVRNNFDYTLGQGRSQIAAANYAIAQSGFLPFFNGAARGSIEKFGEYTMNGIGNEDTNRSEGLPPDQHLPNPYPELFAGVTFGWEANLWGKLSARKESARARMLASVEAIHGLKSWIIYRVADRYYELIGLDQRRDVLLENIQLQELALELVKIQKAGGKVNQLAVDQFESQLYHTKTLLVQVEQDIRMAEAAINNVMARYPQPLNRTPVTSYPSSPEFFTGDPDRLIFNRPDVREKEFMLGAANADVVAARAAFYPSLRLTGAAGLSSLKLTTLFNVPGAVAYSIGGGLTMPLLQRRQIKALYAQAGTRQRMALIEYQKTLLTAYYEVYGVLNNCHNISAQIALKQREAEVQRRAFSSSKDLFGVGYATYLEVITAQRRMLEVELELATLRKDQLRAVALLYRALGGGWREPGDLP